MKTFIYYERNQNFEEDADVAAVKAESLKEAVNILKNYYVLSN